MRSGEHQHTPLPSLAVHRPFACLVLRYYRATQALRVASLAHTHSVLSRVGHFAAEAVHLACHRCYGQVSSVQMYRNKTVIKCMLHLAGIFPPISYAHVVTPEATGCTPLRLPSNGAFLLHSTLDLEMRSHRPRFS